MTPDAITIGAVVIGSGHALRPFIDRILGPTSDALGEHFGQKVRNYLAANTIGTISEAEEMVRRSGRDVHEIPFRTALPLLEGAAREDEPEVRKRWAALLANAAIGADDDSTRLFASTLSQLTPLSAKFLDALAIACRANRESWQREVRTARLDRWGATPVEVATTLGMPDDARIEFLVDLLIRQALVEREPSVRSSGNFLSTTERKDIAVTVFGWAFLDACSPP